MSLLRDFLSATLSPSKTWNKHMRPPTYDLEIYHVQLKLERRMFNRKVACACQALSLIRVRKSQVLHALTGVGRRCCMLSKVACAVFLTGVRTNEKVACTQSNSS
jgi:hypothetical protein